MIIALMLAAAAPPSAIEAERAFAADAQKNGQWSAFRRYAAPEALMFVAQPTNAQAWLRGRKDPPFSVFWWPGRSYVSCDGTVAINTGPWVREFGKSVGYFTTVWARQPGGGWKWIYDGGDELKFARDEGGDIKPVIAACGKMPPAPAVPQAPPTFRKPVKTGSGTSPDRTLVWSWAVDSVGARRFVAQLWDGKAWQPVIDDKVEAPARR